MLQEIVYSKLTDEEATWLRNKTSEIEKDSTGNKFILTYSLIFRFISKDNITFEREELSYFDNRYPSFSNATWNKHTLCRALIMATLPISNNKEALQKLLGTCSVQERKDFFKNLYFLENAAALTSLVKDGIRTNTTDILEAIGLHNPYPANYLEEDAWNQLILKTIFTERPLYKVYGLRKRKNEKLALILNDFIHERWSAGRSISPEVWQLLSGYTIIEIEETIQQASKNAKNLEKKALEVCLQERNPNTTENSAVWNEIGKEFNQP